MIFQYSHTSLGPSQLLEVNSPLRARGWLGNHQRNMGDVTSRLWDELLGGFTWCLVVHAWNGWSRRSYLWGWLNFLITYIVELWKVNVIFPFIFRETTAGQLWFYLDFASEHMVVSWNNILTQINCEVVRSSGVPRLLRRLLRPYPYTEEMVQGVGRRRW